MKISRSDQGRDTGVILVTLGSLHFVLTVPLLKRVMERNRVGYKIRTPVLVHEQDAVGLNTSWKCFINVDSVCILIPLSYPNPFRFPLIGVKSLCNCAGIEKTPAGVDYRWIIFTLKVFTSMFPEMQEHQRRFASQ